MDSSEWKLLQNNTYIYIFFSWYLVPVPHSECLNKGPHILQLLDFLRDPNV